MVFFPCFYSIVVTHRNGDFSIAFPINVSRVLYAIMVLHRSLNFTWHHFYPLPILSTVFPRVLINFPSVLLKVSIVFPFFSHCFTSYPLVFSIVFLIIFPSIAISPSPARRADLGGVDTSPSPNCHLVHNPKKVYLGPPYHLIS